MYKESYNFKQSQCQCQWISLTFLAHMCPCQEYQSGVSWEPPPVSLFTMSLHTDSFLFYFSFLPSFTVVSLISIVLLVPCSLFLSTNRLCCHSLIPSLLCWPVHWPLVCGALSVVSLIYQWSVLLYHLCIDLVCGMALVLNITPRRPCCGSICVVHYSTNSLPC